MQVMYLNKAWIDFNNTMKLKILGQERIHCHVQAIQTMEMKAIMEVKKRMR